MLSGPSLSHAHRSPGKPTHLREIVALGPAWRPRSSRPAPADEGEGDRSSRPGATRRRGPGRQIQPPRCYPRPRATTRATVPQSRVNGTLRGQLTAQQIQGPSRGNPGGFAGQTSTGEYERIGPVVIKGKGGNNGHAQGESPHRLPQSEASRSHRRRACGTRKATHDLAVDRTQASRPARRVNVRTHRQLNRNVAGGITPHPPRFFLPGAGGEVAG